MDVPESVTCAFSAYAAPRTQEGRGCSQRLLVPVGRKGQRLYVNGGMRSAACVGGMVRFDLRPTREDDVTPFEDLATALAARRVRPVFGALSPSNRRQLLRFIDDARMPQSLAKKVAEAVDKVLRRPSDRARLNADRPLWTYRIAATGSSAAISTTPARPTPSLRRSRESRPPSADLFAAQRKARRGLRARQARALYHDRVSFMVRVRFADAVPKTPVVRVGVWLRRRVERPLFHQIETISHDVHWRVARITEPEQFDALASLLCEAYAVGAQEPAESRWPR